MATTLTPLFFRLFSYACLLVCLVQPASGTYGAGGAANLNRVLLIGDSLSAGPFGREMQHFLIDQFGESRMYLIAACGSSPENWLNGEPEFTTRCGYRVKTPKQNLLGEYDNGRRPDPFPVPKLETLLPKVRPNIVLVQLGTNWFDILERNSSAEEIQRLEGILERFVRTVQSAESHPELIWISPPDSARFRSVQGKVTDLLKRTARKKRFRLIDSSSMVRYVPGQSGGDGVHYSAPDAEKWAAGVKSWLRSRL